MSMLAVEIGDLNDSGFDLDLLGFSEEEIEDLLAAPIESTEGLTDEDAAPEVQETPVAQAGDVWLLGNHRLMCGDSTDAGSVALLMNGEKADMIFTDPPYGVDYEGINNDSREGLADLLENAFQQYAANCKPGAPVYVFHSDRCADIFHEVFRRYCHFSSMIVWVKQSLVLSQTDYQSQHEPCLYGWLEGAAHPWFSDRKQTSVWQFDKERVEGHTTPKPVALIERAITNSSKSGQVVVDLFGGSGSTLIAAEKNGRVARLMELDPRYCDVIVKRWQDFTGKAATLEGDGRTFDEIKAERLPE
jgi:DNA modification methylase